MLNRGSLGWALQLQAWLQAWLRVWQEVWQQIWEWAWQFGAGKWQGKYNFLSVKMCANYVLKCNTAL